MGGRRMRPEVALLDALDSPGGVQYPLCGGLARWLLLLGAVVGVAAVAIPVMRPVVDRDPTVQSVVQYADGPRRVHILKRRLRGATFDETQESFAVVRGDPRLREWGRAHSRQSQIDRDSEEAAELGGIIAALVRASDSAVRNATDHVLGNVIGRNLGGGAASPSQYTNVVHRDLDEAACANFGAKHGLRSFYNAWVPLGAVVQDPLALLLPSSRGGESQGHAVGFHSSLEHDRTGLRHHSRHQWVYFDGLQPGDALLWHSQAVYHASFTLPSMGSGGTQPRRSVDIRIMFP
uniref:Phytanoyl-CoA dioxygenase n=1 Tax=Eutreptiella gymnastica TaxID=73025 RepID=A0A7S1HU44_9EUGL|mmetsp:Transcript_105916/g.182675  ORF Transcript_105916/g.182675 Transcript_105916/m.182675 type:complete len:292 (+) Transcript_105916:28-903(+)